MLANLKALRTAQGLSQRALADFVKVSQQSIIPTNLTDAELRLILNFRQLDDDQQRSMNLLVMQMTKDNKRNAKPQE